LIALLLVLPTSASDFEPHRLDVREDSTELDFSLPSGLRVVAELTGRVPWDEAKPDTEGPEGWAAKLPSSFLPTHYYVHSLASPAAYKVDGLLGTGFAHQESNRGSRLPAAWVWIQGGTAEGVEQLVVTGGAFTLAGVTTEQFIVAYRSAQRQWTFRSINLDRIWGEPDGCTGSFNLSARSSSGRRLFDLQISAPLDSFSDSLYVPTRTGFREGSSESFGATAHIRLYDEGDSVPVEDVSMNLAALEFGGQYRCQDAQGEHSAAPSAMATQAFVSPFLPARAAGPHCGQRPGSSCRLSPGHGSFVATRPPARSGVAPLRAGNPLTMWPVSTAVVAAALCAVFLAFRRRREQTLQEGIAKFYDASSGIWIEIWGEHMHHGYYPPGFKGTLEQHKAAQVEMIEQVLNFGCVPQPGSAGAPKSVLDVGCGAGGASRHIQRKYGCKTTGITLSPYQRDTAEAMSVAAGQGEDCRFLVADALKMPFEDNSFDVVWSLESGEHMPHKEVFMSEMNRVCKPGGRVILVTWVHRDLEEGEAALRPNEQRLLKRISEAYYLPDWCSLADYKKIAENKLGWEQISTDDWTDNIAPFWGAVIRTAIQPRGWWALIRGGLETFRGALVMPLMTRGYETGTIKFGCITGVKPMTPMAASASASAAAGTGSKAAQAVTSLCPAFHTRGVRPAIGRSLPSLWKSASLRASKARRFTGSATKSTMSPLGALAQQMVTLWDFTRPHTLIGTLISIPTVHFFAVVPVLATGGTGLAGRVAVSILASLAPALLVNIYITGLNQIYDVEIDAMNKPYLPIPSGRLSVKAATRVVLACLLGAFLLAWSYPPSLSGPALYATLAGSAVLGTAYSMPPFRLKRSPFLAAFCIVVVRGLVVNLGFYLVALRAAGGPALAVLDARGWAAGIFFAVFGLTIALLKDVPDVLGDQSNGIRSLSVRIGPERVFKVAAALLRCLFLVTSGAFAVAGISAAVGGAATASAVRPRVALAAVSLVAALFIAKEQRLAKPFGAQTSYNFYMSVWKVFYLSYLVLPLAR